MNVSQAYRAPGFTMIPEEILQTFERDRAQILTEEVGVPILTDSTPWLEYYLFFRPVVHEHNRFQLETWEGFLRRIDGCDQTCQDGIEPWYMFNTE